MGGEIVSIGLEIHVALATDRKAFAPESRDGCSWVSFGFVGTLPTLNTEAVEGTIRLARALNCSVDRTRIAFDRKNYFYHDLPRGYQITQHFRPMGTGGHVDLCNGRRIAIRQVHMEEDTAQQFRHADSISFNFSRLGRALAELVTEPDFRTYGEVEEFLRIFRRICAFNGISEAAYEDGEMRVDLNISVRASDDAPLNPKSEVKNLNSLQAIRGAIDHLVALQREALRAGRPLESLTYSWCERHGRCEAMRRKGSWTEYFYVPEANIPAFELPEERYVQITSGLVTDFDGLRRELSGGGLKESEVEFLLGNHGAFRAVRSLGARLGSLPSAYNWMVNIVSGMMGEGGWSSLPLAEVEELVAAVESEDGLSLRMAKDLLREMLEKGIGFREAKRLMNVSLISDRGEIRRLVEASFERYRDQMSKLLENPTRLEKLIIGECMRRSRGQADPVTVKAVFDEVVASWG